MLVRALQRWQEEWSTQEGRLHVEQSGNASARFASVAIRFLSIIQRRVKFGMNSDKPRDLDLLKSVRACGRIRSHPQWNPYTDACALVWLGIDFERPIEKLDALPHADKPEANFVGDAGNIEPHAVIAYFQPESANFSVQTDAEVTSTAVLDGIVKSFLDQAKDRKRHIAWENFGNIHRRESDHRTTALGHLAT